jgi:hypothetical protein
MRTILLIAAGAFLLAGCDPPPPRPTKPTERAGGLVSQIIDRRNELVTETEMHDLHLYMEGEASFGQIPSRESVLEYARKNNDKLYKLLENGAIVLTGAKTREEVWAYEKDAPTKGGWVVTGSGQSKMTADQLNKLLRK